MKNRGTVLSNEKDPNQYGRRVLLAVAGTTPQIITSTLWALTRPEYGFIPTEIHVMTTAGAENVIRDQLLAESSGEFHRFCRDYGLTGKIAFSAENISILKDSRGNPLLDIVTPEDNNLAADQITSWLREFTSDPDCAIHGCLAGGRKTMGFYLGYGLSLFGRPQDKLSHALSSQEFEKSRAFYPSPSEAALIRKTGVSTFEEGNGIDEAKILLAEIPVVRLRDGMPQDLLKGKASYTETVEVAQKILPDNRLVIDEGSYRITCGGIEVKMQPKALAFYIWHARRRSILGENAWVSWKDTWPERDTGSLTSSVMEEYLSIYLRVLGNDKHHPDYLDALVAYKDGFEKDEWADVKKKVNDPLKILGSRNFQDFSIEGRKLRRGPLKHCALRISPEKIIFTNTSKVTERGDFSSELASIGFHQKT